MMFYKDKETGWIYSPRHDRRGFEDYYDEITLQELIEVVNDSNMWTDFDEDIYDYIFVELELDTEDKDMDELWEEVKRYAGL